MAEHSLSLVLRRVSASGKDLNIGNSYALARVGFFYLGKGLNQVAVNVVIQSLKG